MPYCTTTAGDAAGNNGIKIFYRTYGHGPIKVLLIVGLAGTHDSWGPQIKGLTGSEIPNDVESENADCGYSGKVCNDGGVEVCAFDNRGKGRSSVPSKRSEYTTTIMANDAIALMDHLGWKESHVFGHSMGGMIACKLAAMVPDRVLSLGLLNVTGGGSQCFPKLNSLTLSIVMRFFMAKTPEERAAVDLDTHYTQDYLEELVGSCKRRAILYKERVKGILANGMQSNHGFKGQISACWTHKLTRKDVDSIRAGGFRISIIHGRYDVIAQISYARRLAKKLYPNAKMVDLHGGHLVSHERTNEVNDELWELIKGSENKVSQLDWKNLPEKSPSFVGSWTLIGGTNSMARSSLSYMYYVLERLHYFLIYLFSVLALFFEYFRRASTNSKPAVRVGTSSITCV